MGGDRGVARAARGTRRSQRRLFPGGQYLGEARRRDRRRSFEARLPLGPATAARAGDLSPQTVITEEILAPRPWPQGAPRCRISPPFTLHVTPPLRWGTTVGSMSKSPRAAKEARVSVSSRDIQTRSHRLPGDGAGAEPGALRGARAAIYGGIRSSTPRGAASRTLLEVQACRRCSDLYPGRHRPYGRVCGGSLRRGGDGWATGHLLGRGLAGSCAGAAAAAGSGEGRRVLMSCAYKESSERRGSGSRDGRSPPALFVG